MLINNKKQLPRENLPPSKAREVNDDSFELNAKIKELELENDIPKQTIEILKKDQGINVVHLKNKEKTMIINALRKKYPLSVLLKQLSIF